MLQKSEKVLVNFVDIVSSRGQFLSNKIKFLSFTTIKGKLAQYLLDLSRQSWLHHILYFRIPSLSSRSCLE